MSDSPTTERSYVAALTGLRGAAALFVFLYHYSMLHPGIRLDLQIPLIGSVLQFPMGFGFAGVDVFFVLSGFLLTLPFARAALGAGPQPQLGTYFKRRFLRVFPAYYAQLFLILIIGAWFLSWKPQTIPSFVAHLLMYFNIGWDPVRPIVGVWWTLPVEMGFYLLLPLLALLMRPRLWVVTLLFGITVSIVYRMWAASHFGPQGVDLAFLAASQLPGSLTEFLFGASAAIIVQMVNVKNKLRPSAWMLDFMFILGIALTYGWFYQVVLPAGLEYWLGHWSMIIAPLVLGLALSTSVLSLYWGSRIGTFLLANRVMYFLGLISYSLYLWHFVIMQQIQYVLAESYGNLSHWVTFPLSTGAVILAASASYYAIERPFYKLRSYRQAKK
jgi:peptidoglycan/LPS O-acetylase OafA/YrhL